MKKIFGTDGIRGKVNVYPITAEFMMSLGRTFVKFLNKKNPKIVIGMDTRQSSPMIHHALAAGINAQGGNIIPAGIIPTPAITHLITELNADAGIMVSASHNPWDDNGIKLFDLNGMKYSDEDELKIEQMLADISLDTPERIGSVISLKDPKRIYIEYLKESFSDFFGIKVVVDCAHGAAYSAAPITLIELGVDVIAINNTPDGANINDNCGALYPQSLAKAVVEHKADVGLALDGDADRLIVVDERGRIVDGDQLLALFAIDLKNKKMLSNNTVISTVMSNIGFDIAMNKQGIYVIRSLVGDRYVVKDMLKHEANLGGENSGHIIFFDQSTTGDGLLAGLHLLRIMQSRKKPISELCTIFNTVPAFLLNIPVVKKIPIEQLLKSSKKILEIKNKLGNKGRLLVRYSGTENKCRILVESPDKEKNAVYANAIAETIILEVA